MIGLNRITITMFISQLCIVFVLFGFSSTGFACKPSPDYKPPTVQGLYMASEYVIIAEIVSVKHAGAVDVAKIKILEQFKGESIDTLFSPGHSCGLNLQAGTSSLFFLDREKMGNALSYPYATSTEDIVKELRSIKERNKISGH